MSSFKLDRQLFNPTLYTRIHSLWFAGHDPHAQQLNPDLLKRWFLAPPAERQLFDNACRAEFAPTLASIGPSAFPNPTAEPFLREIQDAATRGSPEEGEDGSTHAAQAALSLVLLLDQIPRNIFRTNEGLVEVYGHYDRIAYSLATALLSGGEAGVARPDLHPRWRRDAVCRQWFYLPLMHSEDLAAHDLFDEVVGAAVEELGGQDLARGILEHQIKFEGEHRGILERFGRYPHRNGALGRVSTKEEREFLEGGGATFGVAQG